VIKKDCLPAFDSDAAVKAGLQY